MNLKKEKILSGAHKVLSACLSLEKGDDLLIYSDETTSDVISFLARAARDMGIDYAILFEHSDLQKYHDPNEDFLWPIKLLMDRTCAILTCLNDRMDCLPFRRRIILNGQGASKRIGHMPGASVVSLAVSDADYAQVHQDCANVALALAIGNRIRLMTRDSRDNSYVLEADIGGWAQIPVTSDGLIPLGAWGNIPGGETYIAPILESATGQIVINCALPGIPLYQPEDQPKAGLNKAILTFEKGALAEYMAESERILEFFRSLEQHAQSQGDPNWRNLAEIGIGTNKGIGFPTGISLVDEKLYGTVHVAIGDNIHHGGTNKSVIHCDMVTFAEVDVDGKCILADAEICFNRADWIEHYSRVEPREVQRQGSHVRRTGSMHKVERQRLYKVISSGAGRLLELQVGDVATAKLAAHAFDLLPADGRYVSVETLLDQAVLSREMLLPVLQLLCDYQLLKCDVFSE